MELELGQEVESEFTPKSTSKTLNSKDLQVKIKDKSAELETKLVRVEWFDEFHKLRFISTVNTKIAEAYKSKIGKQSPHSMKIVKVG